MSRSYWVVSIAVAHLLATGCKGGGARDAGSDLPPGCGDGIVQEPGELCDVAIGSDYRGGCPDTCDDHDRCTTDTVVGAACNVRCEHASTTTCVSGDGCCAPGCTLAEDAECVGACATTTCAGGDDCCPAGCTGATDADCDDPAAFRIYSMRLLDPHALTPMNVPLVACFDITNHTVSGISAVNVSLATSLDDLVLNPILIFDPPAREDGATHPMRIVFGECSSTTQCSAGGSPPIDVAATFTNGSVLGPHAGTANPTYRPLVQTVSGDSFVTSTIPSAVVPIQLVTGPLDLPLESVQLAGLYEGDPATGLVEGLLRGFVSEEAAAGAPLPDGLPFIDGQPMALVFRGGLNNGCPGDDRERLVPTQPAGPTNPSGWWFYVAFRAQRVTFQ